MGILKSMSQGVGQMRVWPMALFVVIMAALAQPAQPPTFCAGARLVQVDVVVRDKSGPVTGLTESDSILLDKGQPQRIAAFSITDARTPHQGMPLHDGVVSNRVNQRGETPASATVLLIDRLNIPIQKDFADLCSLLNAKSVDYLIVGGYAVASTVHHVLPDLDILIHPALDHVDRLLVE